MSKQPSDPKPTSINKVKRELGLPKSAVFYGYAVNLLSSDEYLAFVTKTRGIEERIWLRAPNYAKIYQDYHEAKVEADHYGKDAVVVLVFDVGDHYYVARVD